MLNGFIQAGCQDHETEKTGFLTDRKRLIFHGETYKHGKDEILCEMCQLANEMMESIKGYGDPCFENQIKQYL